MRQPCQTRNDSSNYITQKHEHRKAEQYQCWRVQGKNSPATLRKQLLLCWIQKTEVKEQGSEQYECCILQESSCQIKIAITSNWRIEVENESCETDRSKMKYVRSTATLLEKHEEANEEVNNSQQVYVKTSWTPTMNSIETV